jgi:hypothetical protein
MKLIKGLSIAVASVVLVCGPSLAVPATNADGDYLFPQRRGNRQFNWQVSDADPNGLNCRTKPALRQGCGTGLRGLIQSD